ncbi:MAG: hypothetical protein QM753_01505 [Thermomicrobiales bacterium]
MDSEVQIKQIVLDRIERCAVCHREFQAEDIKVISRRPDVWTMLVECEDCHARNFVAAVMNDGDPHAAQLALRRLTEEAVTASRIDIDEAEPEFDAELTQEYATAPGTPAIDAGDVVDMHEFLQDFDGDFRVLFR